MLAQSKGASRILFSSENAPPDGGRAVVFQPVQGTCQQFYTTPRQSPRTSTLFIFAGIYPCRNPPVAQETMPDRSFGNDYAGLVACARNARNSAFHIIGSRWMGRGPQAIVVLARTQGRDCRKDIRPQQKRPAEIARSDDWPIEKKKSANDQYNGR
jgi:hypothetical protein